MNKLRGLEFSILLYPGILAGALWAQVPESTPDCTGPACSVAPAQEDTSQDAVQNGQEHYAGTLDGTGLISLAGSIPSHLLLGVTLSGGWDSNPDSLNQGVASPFYVVSPYLAFQRSTPKTETLVQYQPTATGYNGMYGTQILHVGSAQILENLSDRWTLKLDGSGSYGQNTIRLLGSQQAVPVGDLPATGPDAAAYLNQGGNVADLSVTLGAAYLLSQQNSLEFGVTDGFTRFAGYAATSSITTSTAAFSRELSGTLRASAYAQNSQYYGSLHCDSYGGGLGLDWTSGPRTSVSLSGGPQFDAAECGAQQGFAYRVSADTRISARSGIYLLSEREPGTSYLGPGLWQSSLSAGYSRQATNTGIMRFDVEYLRTSGLGGGSYDATYGNAEYDHSLGSGLIASFTYRNYIDGSGGTYTRRNVALFSIEWAPGRLVSLSK